MRLRFRFFALLDLIALVFMGMQLWHIATHPLADQLSEKIKSIIMFPVFLLVLIGALGLFFAKKFGFILYYIQFPFRLYLWIFSVGFITLLPEALSIYDDKWFDVLLKTCIMAEFIRLYLTIKGHIKFNDLD